jgi:predicted site-specific integrase-resolvase
MTLSLLVCIVAWSLWNERKSFSFLYKLVRMFKVDSHYTSRHDKIFLYGFDLLEITLAGHRRVVTKIVSFTLEENNTSILPVNFSFT